MIHMNQPAPGELLTPTNYIRLPAQPEVVMHYDEYKQLTEIEYMELCGLLDYYYSTKNAEFDSFKDGVSTGRKRAAKMYPINPELPCEWANLVNAGGGDMPILGCGLRTGTINNQSVRHHGPDYNTLNNGPANINMICASCHNTWHHHNDPTRPAAYLRKYGHKPSDKE
jgi:hypothetical protein